MSNEQLISRGNERQQRQQSSRLYYNNQRLKKQNKIAPTTTSKKNKAPKPFERIFHNAPARLLDFFIMFKEYDYTEADIARRTNLTPKTVSNELETLMNERIIKLTRKVGRSNMYTLDSENVRGLVQYIDDTIKQAYDKM